MADDAVIRILLEGGGGGGAGGGGAAGGATGGGGSAATGSPRTTPATGALVDDREFFKQIGAARRAVLNEDTRFAKQLHEARSAVQKNLADEVAAQKAKHDFHEKWLQAQEDMLKAQKETAQQSLRKEVAAQNARFEFLDKWQHAHESMERIRQEEEAAARAKMESEAFAGPQMPDRVRHFRQDAIDSGAAQQARARARRRHEERGLLGDIFGPRMGKIAAALRSTRSPRRQRARSAGIRGGIFGGVLGVAGARRRHGKEGSRAGAAAIALVKIVETAITATVRSLGEFSSALVSASPQPGQFMQQTGQALSSFSEKLFIVSPLLGSVGNILGTVAQSGGRLMDALDGMVDRYKYFSGPIAAAEAQAEARQVFGDVARAQQATPDLVRFIQQRSDLQQKIEDAKLEFMKTIMPLALAMADLFSDVVLPILKTIMDGVALIAKVIPGVEVTTKSIDEQMREFEQLRRAAAQVDLTTALMAGFVDPTSARARRNAPDDPFVRVPTSRGRQGG